MRLHTLEVSVLFLFLVFLYPSGAQQENAHRTTDSSGPAPQEPASAMGPTVIPEIQHVTSPPLRELVQVAPRAVAQRVIPLRRIRPPQRGAVAPQVLDPVVQESAGPLVGTTSGLNFDGIAADGFTPPDTNGSVGATQFVETVNTEFAVYNKSNGALLLGPTNFSTLFGTIGGLCATGNISDPIVLYDKAAGRWLLSVLTFDNTFSSSFECVAVSTSSDATGSYHLYSFSFGSNLNDYPKFGVWPDAYYFSAVMFANGASTIIGPQACAFPRSAMLAGNPASMICFQLSTSDGVLMPSDLDGSTQPPAGEPTFFMELATNSLNLFKFHVDFTTPGNSTFTGPTNIPVAAYTQACIGSFGTCIPQGGTLSQLDSLGDRLMFRLAYRNFGDHESLVVNHSVQVDPVTGQVGVRWYEVHNPNGTPTIFQQSTFAPDANFRWMGSIAVDHAGDMAMGYSVSSNSLKPQIHYTGRAPSDPLNTMETEATIINGTGSQLTTTRWGDYTSMSIDPVDDCTFWYSNEYLTADGDFNWHTRIGSFYFPPCSTTGPFVSLSATFLSFAAQVMGTTSGAQPVTLTNIGSGPLTITGIVASGDFAQTNNCPVSPVTLAAGTNCTLNVTFAPTAIGNRTGTVTITDNAPGNPQTIQLTGPGLSLGVVSFSPPSLTFPNTIVGTASAAQTLKLTNIGTGPLTISSISLFGDFAQTNNCPISPASLTAGANCTFSVAFTPRLISPESGSISIVDDSSVSPATIGLNGTGVASAVSLSPSTLSFTTQGVGTTSAAQTIMATNNTGTTISITSIVASGDFAQTKTCAASLAPAATCTISVTFTPTVTGTRTGSVTIIFNGLGSPQTTSLTGRGTSQAASLLAWKLKAPFNDPRTKSGVEGAAANLISGKLYVSHGYRFGDSAFLSIYDVATDSWIHGGPTAPDAKVLRSEMAGGSALGKHFAIGGRTGPTTANEQFDPSTTLWTTKAPLSMARGGLGAASVNDKIYVMGGRTGSTYGVPTILSLAEVYDPTADAWTTLAPLPVAVSDNYATVALNGKIYVFGGTTGGGPGTTNLVQIYDIAGNTWSPGAPMPTARGAAMAGVIAGKIAVFGGVGASLTDLAVTELYDPATDTWQPGPDMASPASEIAQGVTSDGTQIFAIGSGIFGVSGSSVQLLVAPVVQLSPPILAMGAQPVGSTSLSQTVMLTNVGGVALPISNIVASGDFAQTNNCPVSLSTLAAGASCIITVTFTPTAPGAERER
jgi:hypothetical protein